MRPTDMSSAGRESVVVCVLCDAADVLASLQSVLANTAQHVPVLVAGTSARQLEELAEAESGRPFWLLHRKQSLLSGIVAATAPADVVFLSRGALVGFGWLERLRAAARSDTTVVTATALADNGGALSVPFTGRDAAESIARRSLGTYPRIMRARAHCVYLRRRAFELVGGPDTAGGDCDYDYDAALGNFSRRCLEHGMVHVAADDVFVRCEPPREAAPIEEFERDDYEDERSTLRRAVRISELAITERLSVTLDARALSHEAGGTQAYIVDLALALARADGAALRLVVTPASLPRELARVLEREPSLELVSYETAVGGVPLTHVVHRPQQVFSEDDVALLRLLGERIVITHQDLIGYRNPSYHESVAHWRQHRRVTRIALAAADKVVFFAEHARNDALAEALIHKRHTEVIGIGSNALWGLRTDPRRPEHVPAEGEFLLCLGADYRHKNRPFAIELTRALRADHGWSGKLVLAGAHVPHGSSRKKERALICGDPELAEAVVDIGPVDEAGKRWLYQHANAVVFPSLYEGFGLIPFEAARASLPCLFAPQTALIDVAGAELASLVPWDVGASAAAVLPLLKPGIRRKRHVRGLLAAANASPWEIIAPQMLAAYERATRSDERAGAPFAWQELERERYIRELAESVEHNRREAERYLRSYQEVTSDLGDSLMLVKRDGWLDGPTRLGLTRVASRPLIRKLSLWPFAMLGRVRRT